MQILTSQRTDITRFAPSPTGYLHAGHGFSALFAQREAGATGAAGTARPNGRFLLRIEDIDTGRCREPFVQAIEDDLHWLGLTWETPVWRQSQRMDIYTKAIAQLRRDGLLYPCFCSRADIKRELANIASAPHLLPHGPDGPVYPGICRELSSDIAAERIAAGEPHSWRLDMDAALSRLGQTLTWIDREQGQQIATPEIFGDIILARRDTPTCYHLSVTIDDAAQGITCVTRGQDLFPATHIHRLLQHLLNLPVPEWHHHPLIQDSNGQRLAKRDGAKSLRDLRNEGMTAEDFKASVGF
jgi:glutamyl-Q tRNA(Asp) synthetase